MVQFDLGGIVHRCVRIVYWLDDIAGPLYLPQRLSDFCHGFDFLFYSFLKI